MKSSLLRIPLIYSATLLVLFSLLVYFTLTSPHGSIWSSFGLIFILIFRTAQLAIGLALAFIVCLAVLIAIFLGAVALFDGPTASRMYEGLRQAVVSWLVPLTEMCKSEKEGELHAGFHELGDKLKIDFTQMIGSTRQELASVQVELEAKVQALQGRLRDAEEAAGEKASVGQFESLSTELSTVTESMAAGDGVLKTLQDKVEKAIKQVDEVDAAQILGDVPNRLDALEQQEPPAPVDLQPVEKKIATLQAEVETLKSSLEQMRSAEAVAGDAAPAVADKQPAKKEKQSAEKEPEKAEDEHRLFSYFTKKKDKDKLAALVADTLKKDMTYAQVTDYLVKKMGAEGGRVISEHPSLAKDYIRQCRRKG